MSLCVLFWPKATKILPTAAINTMNFLYFTTRTLPKRKIKQNYRGLLFSLVPFTASIKIQSCDDHRIKQSGWGPGKMAERPREPNHHRGSRTPQFVSQKTNTKFSCLEYVQNIIRGRKIAKPPKLHEHRRAAKKDRV